MQFLEYISLLQKYRLSYAIYEISSSSTKTWTIICNLWNLFPFSKNVDYHMQFMKFLSFLRKHGQSCAISDILYLLLKRGLSYEISEISFSSPKTWTILCNL